ncbi:MAG: hypothetical protein R3E89_19520, partial [Thiolinea sp.]
AFYAPTLVDMARAQLQQVETTAAADDRDAALAALTSLSDTLTGTSAYLPVQYIAEEIDAAMQAISAGQHEVETALNHVGNVLDTLTSPEEATP